MDIMAARLVSDSVTKDKESIKKMKKLKKTSNEAAAKPSIGKKRRSLDNESKDINSAKKRKISKVDEFKENTESSVTSDVTKKFKKKILSKTKKNEDKEKRVEINNENVSKNKEELKKYNKKHIKGKQEIDKMHTTSEVAEDNIQENDVSSDDDKFLSIMGLSKDNLKNCIQALTSMIDIKENEKKSLFTEDKPPLLLSIACIKIPETPTHHCRMLLPHSLVSDDDEVALFVKDLQRGRRRDYEPTIQHFQNLLREHGCTRVKDIIPMNQVKTEFKQFEMRRKLFHSYDYFLTDGRISGHLAHILGKKFNQKRKLPTSINMESKDLKREIDYALRKTSLNIHGLGDNSIVQVANMKMDITEIIDNIQAVCIQLKKHYPGGWTNIRNLQIKTPTSLAIPIYMTTRNKNEVPVPKVKPRRPKAYRDVTGELSTLEHDKNVIVSPEGTITVIPLKEELEKTKDGEAEQ